jgi:glucokinase
MGTAMNVLAGDIGGTKTVLAILSSEKGAREPLAKGTFPSGKYPSLEAIVGEFMWGKGITVQRASFGVSGPVVNGRARITNLPWIVDSAHLSEFLGGAEIGLFNDLQAIGNSVPYLDASDVETLNAGHAIERGVIAIVAPGTGLGEAYLVWDGAQYVSMPSEGGHSSFSPNGPLQLELLRYLQPRFGHVSHERVCSGSGLPNLYAFLKETGRSVEPEWLAKQLAESRDPNPIIVQNAVEGTAEICMMAVDLFAAILGAEAGNMALKVMSTGGVYLGGGMPPRILPRLRQVFLQAFEDKGRLSEVLDNMPVHVITRPDAALFGSACHALRSSVI